MEIQKNIKNNFPIITLSLLILLLVYLVNVNKSKLFQSTNSSVISQTELSSKPDFPVSIESKNVNGVLIHYYFTGKLKELKKTSLGTQIIYEDADQTLPALVAGPKTRVEKITPPYELNAINININSLKVGQIIDISAEYDVRSNTWNVLDVFLATDRN